MKKKLIMPCATLIALVLEILPYGAVLNFANPDGGRGDAPIPILIQLPLDTLILRRLSWRC